MSCRFRSGSEVNTHLAMTSRSTLESHSFTWLSHDYRPG